MLSLSSLKINLYNALMSGASNAAMSLDFLSGTLDSRITFTRGSNAMMVDSTGKLTYAPNNLVTNSEAFDNASWVKFGTTSVLANANIAPNGTMTADAITIPSASGIYRNVPSLAGTGYVASIWLRSDTPQTVRLVSNTDTSVIVSTTCSVTTSWQRFSVYRVAPAGSTTVNLQLDTGGGGTFYVWGAQLEAVTYQTLPSTYNSTSPANLLGFTQEFDNAAWTKTSSTVVANATTAPDGTLTADSGVTGGSAFQTNQAITITSGTSVTGSVYLKPNGIDVVEIVLLSSGNITPYGRASFNVATGVISTAAATANGGTNVSAAITPAGNGWYRCSVTVTYPAVTAAGMRINATGATGGIFLWGAQLSNSGSVDPYVYNPAAALTSTAYYGPRFDYDPATLASKGLLIEEQRTNLMFPADGTTGWSASPVSSMTATANSLTSPDGTTNATKVATNDTLSNGHVWYKTFSGAISTAYVGSVYLKAGEYSRAQVAFANTGFANTTTGALFNLSNGTVVVTAGGSTATITAVGGGWYRCTVTATSDADGGAYVLGVSPRPASVTTIDPLFTSASVGLGAYVYGIQVEAGAFATSLIPTVSAQVTRSADVATMVGDNFANWYNATEGTIVTKSSNFSTGSFPVVAAINNGLLANRITAIIPTTSGSSISVVDASVTQASFSFSAYVTGTVISTALAIKANDFAGSINGATVQTDASGTVPTVTQMQLGVQAGGLSPLNGHIRSITYYNSRLPNATLQSLTV